MYQFENEIILIYFTETSTQVGGLKIIDSVIQPLRGCMISVFNSTGFTRGYSDLATSWQRFNN